MPVDGIAPEAVERWAAEIGVFVVPDEVVVEPPFDVIEASSVVHSRLGDSVAEVAHLDDASLAIDPLPLVIQDPNLAQKSRQGVEIAVNVSDDESGFAEREQRFLFLVYHSNITSSWCGCLPLS